MIGSNDLSHLADESHRGESFVAEWRGSDVQSRARGKSHKISGLDNPYHGQLKKMYTQCNIDFFFFMFFCYLLT